MGAQPARIAEPDLTRNPTERVRPRLTVAPPPPPPVAVPRAPFIGLVLLVVAAGVFGVLVLNTKIDENAFRLNELREEQAALDQRQQELDEQIAEASSTSQLAAKARQLGLVRVPTGEVGQLRMPDGEIAGNPVPAGAAGDGPEPGPEEE